MKSSALLTTTQALKARKRHAKFVGDCNFVNC
jgi:hypothetical protein